MTQSSITIATRKSPLALWQAEFVQHQLVTLYPDKCVDLFPLSTKGDEILDKSLAKIGGKGLFIKALEEALIRGEGDIAVHSMKDVSAKMPSGFELAAVLPRGNSADAFVSNNYKHPSELPEGSVVGTSSLRRQSQLLKTYPYLRIKPLRGNVGTRLNKLDQGEFDAIVLASAGLERLGFVERIRYEFTPEEMLPAVSQGVLGIEICAQRTDMQELLTPLHDITTTALVTAERACAAMLNASCQSALGVFADYPNDDTSRIRLRALLASEDGVRCLKVEQMDAADQSERLGGSVAQALLDQGGAILLR